MSNERKIYNLQQLERLTKEALDDKELPNKLDKSVNSISKIFTSIINTKGEGWTSHMVDENGAPLLTPTERIRFEEEFKPYIRTILNYFNSEYSDDIDQSSAMYGGVGEEVATLQKELKEKNEEISKLKNKLGSSTSTTSSENQESTVISPDGIFEMLMDKIGNIDSIVKHFAGDWGILKLQRHYDETGDIQIIPQPLIELLNGLTEGGFEVAGEFLSKIKISFRVFLFAIYLFLDVARVAAGLSNKDYIRKIMSIILSILELLRGEWKKSILSFIGYFGTSPMLVGAISKVFLVTFELMDPQNQESILVGSFDSAKSIVVGLLLNIFQITAPFPVRQYLAEAFSKIRDVKLGVNASLQKEGISPRPDYLVPSFEDINNLQAVIADRPTVCSKEFQDAIADVYNNNIMRIILEILRIPVSSTMQEYICGDYNGKTFTEILKMRQDNFNNYKKSLEKSNKIEQSESAPPVPSAPLEQQKEEENNSSNPTPTQILSTPQEEPTIGEPIIEKNNLSNPIHNTQENVKSTIDNLSDEEQHKLYEHLHKKYNPSPQSHILRRSQH